tara:strand:- start:2237 stop:3334 length:1098 start_codon:yes stop_codon:yes gene_type:complete
MSTGKTNTTSTQFAAKKLLGKAHTSNLKSDVNESVPSNVSLPSETIFGEAIPNDPGTAFYTMYSASAGGPATVEQVYFDIVSISDTIYDADDTGGGGDESSASGPHGYYLKLPAAYQTTSSNPAKGTGAFTNGKRVYDSRGALQLVPPLISNASPNRYFLKLYKGDPADPANEITSGDSIDWQVDYYSGIVFIQDYNASQVPVTASAYLYVGEYLDEKLASISASAGGGTVDGSGANTRLAFWSDADTLTADANLTFANSTLSVDGGLKLKRRTVTAHVTASASDYFIGVNSSGGSFDVRLLNASSLEDGQTIVIKDEGGATNTNPVNIRAHPGQTIDGQQSIILESPFAAVSLYSNGSNAYFIY